MGRIASQTASCDGKAGRARHVPQHRPNRTSPSTTNRPGNGTGLNGGVLTKPWDMFTSGETDISLGHCWLGTSTGHFGLEIMAY